MEEAALLFLVDSGAGRVEPGDFICEEEPVGVVLGVDEDVDVDFLRTARVLMTAGLAFDCVGAGDAAAGVGDATAAADDDVVSLRNGDGMAFFCCCCCKYCATAESFFCFCCWRWLRNDALSKTSSSLVAFDECSANAYMSIQ